MPPDASPQVWYPAAATAVNVRPPATAAGVATSAVSPLPIRPALAPQQYAAPPGVSAQVWYHPALTLAKVRPPLTAVGAAAFAWLPLPNWPRPFEPQQYKTPAAVSPQV